MFCNGHKANMLLILCLAGMLKESQLWQVYTERSTSGSYAASLEVPPPATGTVPQPILYRFCCIANKMLM